MIIQGQIIKSKQPFGKWSANEQFRVKGFTDSFIVLVNIKDDVLLFVSLDEFTKYFYKERPVKKKKWGEWCPINDPGTVLDGQTFTIEFRSDSAKNVQVCCKEFGFLTEAHCHPNDTFDLNYGVKLAYYRMLIKIMKRIVANYQFSEELS